MALLNKECFGKIPRTHFYTRRIERNEEVGWSNAYCSRALLTEFEDSCWATIDWCMETCTEDEGEFMTLELLMCPEIGVAYIMDYYGARILLSFYTETPDEIYRQSLPKTRYLRENIKWVADACQKMTGLKLMFYNKGHFRRLKTQYERQLIHQLQPIYKYLPNLCLNKIVSKLRPEWMKVDMGRRLMPSRKNYIDNVIIEMTSNNGSDYMEMLLW